MNTLDKEKELNIKIPFLIPIIVVVIIGVIVAQNDLLNTRAEAISKDTEQEKVEIEKNEKNTEENQNSMIYTAEDGKQYEIIATLNIPSLGIKYPVLSSTTEELLKVSLTKYWGGNPNEVGNLVILGHNYENTKFFSKLHNIKIGDIVQITDLKGQTLDYTVYETDIIDPDNNDCTSQLTDGHTEITLITCYNKSLQRFVVKARAN